MDLLPAVFPICMNQNKTEDEEYFKKGKRQSSLIDPLQVLLAYFESSPNFFYVAHRTVDLQSNKTRKTPKWPKLSKNG